MSAKIIQLRDAVIGAINGREFAGIQPESQASFGSQIDLYKNVGLVVRVVTGALTDHERETRASFVSAPRIDIGIGKKLATTAEADRIAEVDALLSFVEEMHEFLADATLQLETKRAICEVAEIDPLFSPDWFQKGEFLSVLSLTYRYV